MDYDEHNMFSYIKLISKNKYLNKLIKSKAKFMITNNGIPIGFPLTQTQAVFVCSWLKSVDLTEIQDYDESQSYLDKKK